MKKTYIIIAAALLLTALSARAQLTTTVTTITHDSTFAEGRDFWFAMMSNYWGVNNGGKYMRIYITSDENCTAFVTSDGAEDAVSITAHQISSYVIPEDLEVHSSGIAEDKAIHVYSNTADLSVYDLSNNYATADGSYIIPTIGWGTDYVIAAYGSLYEENLDDPSTCMITANQDNTTFEFTPTCDCRNCTTGTESGDGCANIVAFPQGVTQTFTLNKGQCMQFMPIQATNADHFDLTGSIIHSNVPVGVSGGSDCPNIPNDFPYCDHVEDMVPPIRTWGETYYAANPIQSDTLPSHDFADYLFIGSQAGQTIYRQECQAEASAECIIPNPYGIYWDELPGTQKFTSTAPFFVVEYINSATYPDNVLGSGDPAEAIINPREQFTQKVVFETPSGSSFDNYANITVNVKDENKTLFDGKSIATYSKQCLDSNWDMVLIPKFASGSHTITGDDSGINVWVYGHGVDETYAWAGPAQCKTFQSPDSIAPIATISTQCFFSFVHLSDSGALASKLNMIRVDSEDNMAYFPDTPQFIEGSETDTSGYSMYVVDPTKPAILVISAFDVAGNHTIITSTYTPIVATIQPPFQNLGVWATGSPSKIAYDTLLNEGQAAFDIVELQLKYGNVGFTLHDSIGGPLDLSPLLPGQRRLIQIQFTAIESKPAVDSIILSDGCIVQAVAVVGSGGTIDFVVTDQTWPNELLGNCYPKTVLIENLSSGPITIDSAWWADTVHFKAVSAFPITVPASPASVPFTIDYCPDSSSLTAHNTTRGNWFSDSIRNKEGTDSARYDNLTGWAISPLSVGEANNPLYEATIIPAIDGRSLEIILPDDLTGSVTFQLVNVLGESVLHEILGVGTQNIDASSLPRGVYFYRLTSGPISQSGKVLLGE
jgi:IgGFc binding protein